MSIVCSFGGFSERQLQSVAVLDVVYPLPQWSSLGSTSGEVSMFRTHRDQILIGSLVNSKQVNGRALQKDTFTARLLLYVYVGYPLPHPPKNSPDLHQS